MPDAGTYDANIEKFATSLTNYFADPQEAAMTQAEFMEAFKRSFSNKFVYLPHGQKLPTTLDATLPNLDSSCSFVQIAVWSQDEKIYVDPVLWDQLDNQNKAALALHELVYMISRSYGEKTSDESRFVIGEIFTNSTPMPRLGPFARAADYLWCGAGGGVGNGQTYEIFFYDEFRNGVSGIGVYFRAISGEYILTRTDGFVPNMNTQKIETTDGFSFLTNANNEARKLQWKFEFAKDMHGQITVRAWQKGSAPAFVNGFCQREKAVSQ